MILVIVVVADSVFVFLLLSNLMTNHHHEVGATAYSNWLVLKPAEIQRDVSRPGEHVWISLIWTQLLLLCKGWQIVILVAAPHVESLQVAAATAADVATVMLAQCNPLSLPQE